MKRSSTESATDDVCVPNNSSSNKKRKVDEQKFHVFPPSLFDRPFPYFSRPLELGSFSLDGDHQYVDSRFRLRVYCPPGDKKVDWDLSKGYDVFIERDSKNPDYINKLLQWIKLHKYEEFMNTENSGERQSPDFVCWRGLLTKLLCTPYENLEGWKVSVCRFKKTLYMCEFDADDAANRQQTPAEEQRHHLMSYWGFKFEQYITAACSNSQPETEIPVNNNEAFVSVKKARLSHHTLVFGGEVDCREKDSECTYVELKTSRIIQSSRQDVNFKRYKLLKWWAQSFLIGIGKLVAGFRDDDGIVRDIREYQIPQLPKISEQLPYPWHPNVCFNFLEKFLDHVQRTVQSDFDKAVYVFSWTPRHEIVTRVYEPKSEYAFLPHWYTAPKATTKWYSAPQTTTDCVTAAQTPADCLTAPYSTMADATDCSPL